MLVASVFVMLITGYIASSFIQDSGAFSPQNPFLKNTPIGIANQQSKSNAQLEESITNPYSVTVANLRANQHNQILTWVADVNKIMDDINTTKAQKKASLMGLLSTNQSNLKAKPYILKTLATLAPAEYIEPLLIYSKQSDPETQKAVIMALAGAMQLTETEIEQNQHDIKFDQSRSRIGPTINSLYYNLKTPDDVKQVILFNYATTNPENFDTKNMIINLVSLQKIAGYLSDGATVYLSNVVTTQPSIDFNDVIETLTTYQQLPSDIQQSIANNMSATLAGNPGIVEHFSLEQKTLLASFIKNNPPPTAPGIDEQAKADWQASQKLLLPPPVKQKTTQHTTKLLKNEENTVTATVASAVSPL